MIKSKDDFNKWIEETKEGVESCKCERCGKEFQIKKTYGKGSTSSSGYYRLKKSDKIICPGCSGSDKFKENYKKKSQKERDDHINKAVKAREKYYSNKSREDSSITYRSLDDLRNALKEGRKGATYICESCGKQYLLKDRHALYVFIRNNESSSKLLCKGCKISTSKISNNENKIITRTHDCSFLEQEYKGSDLEKRTSERSLYKFKCNKCGKEFESPFFPNHDVACPYCHTIMASHEEKTLLDFIRTIYKGTIIENDRKTICPYELDIYLPEVSLAIEYDGSYWHSQKPKDYHLNKTIACEEKGITLLHIISSDNIEEALSLIQNYIEGNVKLKEKVLYDRRFYSPIGYNYEAWPPRLINNGGFPYWDCGSFKIKKTSD